MNILPKKRWHVRTKDNIARVRRDEAEAREKELIVQKKIEIAESEARINFLRKKSGFTEQHKEKLIASNNKAPDTEQHVDLFADYKTHIKNTNKELEKEKKEEREKYEKQIGYLTYLGQDTNEALKLKSWYELAPKNTNPENTKLNEVDIKNKCNEDPLTFINNVLPPNEKLKSTVQPNISIAPSLNMLNSNTLKTSEKYEKTHKRKSKEKKKKKKKKHEHKNLKKYETKEKSKYLKQQKTNMLEKLRKERLRREAEERLKQEELFAPKNCKAETNNVQNEHTSRIVQKYNSQFNPEIAKQNMLS